MPVECSAVFNAGAVRFNGQYLLVLRVEDYARQVNFHVATSRDGVRFEVNPTPIEYPLRAIEQQYGTYRFDMRITPLDGQFYVCHAVWITGLGCMIGMARTRDFVKFEPLPHVSVPFNRNAVLFPEKIRGLYARLERPMDEGGRIWVTYSPDLRFWGDAMPLNLPTQVWNWRKTGAGAMPIKTAAGWLTIYHGTAKTASSENYYLGVALLDLEDPSRVIAAPKKFILHPQEHYECVGQVPNVVFTCGAVETDDGQLNIYYAGADTCVCLAQTSIAALLDFCRA
ncbi:MAG: 1,4-beta-mannosyl-N-acetylglucosamine phosphorylase [Verrucomicrobiae bacterium]|nr:1,4-beta-mannosyl-N-acetylglucosamine phosphorylase [Verrucomicrobiae bacterium]